MTIVRKSLVAFSIITTFATAGILFGQWKPTHGPGPPVGVATIYEINSTIYAGTSTGVFSTTDNGMNWTLVKHEFIGSIAAIRQLGKYIIAAGGNPYAAGGNMFRTTSDDSVWRPITNGLTNAFVNALAVDSGIIYAGSSYGVYISTDSGATWGTVTPTMAISELAVDGEYIYAASSDSGLFRFAANGNGWSSVGVPTRNITALAAGGGAIYIGTLVGGMYRSTDNGAHWSSINNGVPPSYGTLFCQTFAIQGADMYASLDGYILHSTNDGDGWDIIDSAIVSEFTVGGITTLSAIGNDLFAASLEQFALTTDGGAHWFAPDCIGLMHSAVSSFAVGSGKLFAAGEIFGFSRSTDNGANWADANGNLASFGIAPFGNTVAVNGDSVYSVVSNLLNGGSEIALTTDDGATWQHRSHLEGFVAALVPYDGFLFAGSDSGLYRSGDGGTSWIKTQSGISCDTIFIIVPFGARLFAITDMGGVFSSLDDGGSWTAAMNGLPQSGASTLTNAGNTLIAGTSEGIYISTNYGETWVRVDTTLTYPSCFAATGTDIFAGSYYKGVFYSTDLGSHWISEDAGLVDSTIFGLAMSGNYLVAATPSNVYLRPLADFGINAVNEPPSSLPASLALAQNYPNPFSGTTNVEFRIPNEELVTLNVYNALGEKVATLAHGVESAGAHSVTFDARGLQSGVYFYRVMAGKTMLTGTMMVAR